EALFFTLMRRGEMFALTQRWIDRRAKLIRIPAAHSKSGEDETIPLHPRALKALTGQARARGTVSLDDPIFGEINVRPAYEKPLGTTLDHGGPLGRYPTAPPTTGQRGTVPCCPVCNHRLHKAEDTIGVDLLFVCDPERPEIAGVQESVFRSWKPDQARPDED